jgi:hypothetical protein
MSVFVYTWTACRFAHFVVLQVAVRDLHVFDICAFTFVHLSPVWQPFWLWNLLSDQSSS